MKQFININLIPPEVKQKRETEKNLAIFITGTVVWVLVLVLIYAGTMFRVQNEEAVLNNLKIENKTLLVQIEKYKVFEERKHQLVQMQELFNQASTGTISWYKLLVQMALVAPQGVSITNFNSDNVTFQINGDAKTMIDVATWLVRLEELPLFEQVWPESVSVSENVVKFVIKGNVVTNGGPQ